MLRVYLDQFAWIRLSRARNRLKVDPGWDDAYAPPATCNGQGWSRSRWTSIATGRPPRTRSTVHERGS